MTKEELEKEAGDYADKHAFRVPYDGSNRFYDDVDFKASKEGYLAGAKPREKRISKLKEVCQDLSDKFDYQVKQVMRLEKENAELKEKLKMTNKPHCSVTNKICFSQKEASDTIRRIKKARNSHRPKNIPQRSYRCQYCGSWHLTHYRNYETCKATLRKNGLRGSERFYD